jgi:Xaa-Pro aminopeptidase
MELFDFKDGVVIIHPAAYTLQPFKKIIDRDKSKNKKNAIEDLAFIYFYCDFKSDFNDILDNKEKIEEIRKVCISREKWEVDEFLEQAINFYIERQETTSSKLLQSTKHALAELDRFYKNLDFEEKDSNGKPIFDVTKIMSSLSNLGKTVQSLKDLEDIVRREREEESRVRGGGSIGDYEE